MDDSQIIELYWQRNEAALTETANKYGSYCYKIWYYVNGIDVNAVDVIATALAQIAAGL